METGPCSIPAQPAQRGEETQRIERLSGLLRDAAAHPGSQRCRCGCGNGEKRQDHSDTERKGEKDQSERPYLECRAWEDGGASAHSDSEGLEGRDMRWKAKNILLTDFDVRGHRTLERTLNDRSVPFLINGTDAGEAMRQALLEGKWIYCPQISKSMPDLHFLHAEKTCNRVMAYTKSPVNKTVYQEKNGKIIPYVPALKKVSKTKRNNSLKM